MRYECMDMWNEWIYDHIIQSIIKVKGCGTQLGFHHPAKFVKFVKLHLYVYFIDFFIV